MTLLTVAILGVILAAVGGFLLVRLRADLVAGVDDTLSTRAAQIALGLGNGCEGEFQDVSDASLVGLPQGESGAQLLGVDGSVRESSGDPVTRRPLVTGAPLADALAGDPVRQTLMVGTDTEPFRILAVALPAGSCRGVVVVATSLDEVDRSVHRLLILMLVGGPAALCAAAAGGWGLSRRALSPVARMTAEAAEIDAGRLDERIEVPGPADEIGRLAVTLNTMLDRVQAGVESKRRFVADASHELRTPLAIMRSELDVSLLDATLDPSAREVLSSARDEAERMSVTVENLLALARLDEDGIALSLEDVDLAASARSAVDAMRPLAEARSVRLSVAGVPAIVHADEERIARVLSNLLANAITYSPAGGEIDVTSWRRDEETGVSVRDHGPGIPAPMVSTIFDRFVRTDGARASDTGGSGLGLAIAKEIVEAHGGRIWVESREGAGATFSFAVPIG